jgi:hypothetical protein
LWNDWASPDFIIPLNFALGLFAPTNHQLMDGKIGCQLKVPYALLALCKEKTKLEDSVSIEPKQALKNVQNSESCIWSNLLNDVRTFFEQGNP